MGSDIGSALCGSCKVPLVSVRDHDPQDWFACSRCGRGDTRQNVLRIVGKHAQVAARHVQESLRKAVGRSKFLQLKGKTIPQSAVTASSAT
jgi:hypothetical protein